VKDLTTHFTSAPVGRCAEVLELAMKRSQLDEKPMGVAVGPLSKFTGEVHSSGEPAQVLHECGFIDAISKTLIDPAIESDQPPEGKPSVAVETESQAAGNSRIDIGPQLSKILFTAVLAHPLQVRPQGPSSHSAAVQSLL